MCKYASVEASTCFRKSCFETILAHGESACRSVATKTCSGLALTSYYGASYRLSAELSTIREVASRLLVWGKDELTMGFEGIVRTDLADIRRRTTRAQQTQQSNRGQDNELKPSRGTEAGTANLSFENFALVHDRRQQNAHVWKK